MIWLLLPLVIWVLWHMAYGIFAQREIPRAARVETWEEKKARLAFENRCDELGRRFFDTVTQPKGD